MVRAFTSHCGQFCKIERVTLFTHFGLKKHHISLSKIVHLCTIATVAVHICTATVAFAFIILQFFLSPSPHSLISASHSHLSLFYLRSLSPASPTQSVQPRRSASQSHISIFLSLVPQSNLIDMISLASSISLTDQPCQSIQPHQ